MYLFSALPFDAVKRIADYDAVACQKMWLYIDPRYRRQMTRCRWPAKWPEPFIYRGDYCTYVFGKLHSISDKPSTENQGETLWHYGGRLHRVGKPAAIYDMLYVKLFKNSKMVAASSESLLPESQKNAKGLYSTNAPVKIWARVDAGRCHEDNRFDCNRGELIVWGTLVDAKFRTREYSLRGGPRISYVRTVPVVEVPVVEVPTAPRSNCTLFFTGQTQHVMIRITRITSNSLTNEAIAALLGYCSRAMSRVTSVRLTAEMMAMADCMITLALIS